MRRKLILFLFFLVTICYGQVTFQAISEKKEIDLQDIALVQFNLSIKDTEVNNISDLIISPFENARVVRKQRVVHREEADGHIVIEMIIYVWLTPIKTGSIKIGPSQVMVGEKIYKTKPLNIQVKNKYTEDIVTSSPEDIFLKLEVPNKTLYKNQAVLAKLKLYTRYPDHFKGIIKNEISDSPGISIKKIETNEEFTYREEIINGEIYLSKVVGVYLIYPTEIGILKIEPFKMSVASDGVFHYQEIQAKSEPVIINVKGMINPPKSFYGLVGDYKILKSSCSKKNLKIDEATVVSVEISGTGNIEMLKIPELILPQGIEKYSPNKDLKLKGMTGKLTISTLLVPRKEGSYDISFKPIKYFNPETKSFKELLIPPISFQVDNPKTVKPNNHTIKSEDTVFSVSKKEVIEPLVKKEADKYKLIQAKEKPNSLNLIIAAIVLLLLGLGGWIFKRNKNKKEIPLTNRLEEKEPDWKEELNNLRKLAEEGDKLRFYTLLEYLLNIAVEKTVQSPSQSYYTIVKKEEILSNKYGDNFVEEYKNLTLKIGIEKVSDISEIEQLITVYIKAKYIIKTLIE